MSKTIKQQAREFKEEFKKGYAEGVNEDIDMKRASWLRWLTVGQIVLYLISINIDYELPRYIVFLPAIFILAIIIKTISEGLKK